jgi:hypothetical protein
MARCSSGAGMARPITISGSTGASANAMRHGRDAGRPEEQGQGNGHPDDRAERNIRDIRDTEIMHSISNDTMHIADNDRSVKIIRKADQVNKDLWRLVCSMKSLLKSRYPDESERQQVAQRIVQEVRSV